MPEFLSLDILSPLEDRPRSVDLFGASVRIGRGPQCEVRLQDAALAEVECLLRRRGTTWYVLPQGMLGNLAIEGRSVEGLMPLDLGMVLRVGEHRLVLRRTQVGPRVVGSFETPIEIDSRTADNERSQSRQQESFARWQTQVAQRDRWLQSRREERRWQARWKAAGQNLPRHTPPPEANVAEPDALPAETVATPSPVIEPLAEAQPEIVAELAELPGPPPVPEVPASPIVEESAPVASTIEPEEFVATVAVEPEPAAEAPKPLSSVEPEPELHHEVPVQVPAAAYFVESETRYVTDTTQMPRALEPPPFSTPEPAEEGWPSVREIVCRPAIPNARTVRAAGPKKTSRSPRLSEPLAPASWSVPVWSALVPATLLVLVLGVGGWKLAWIWGQDDKAAGILADRLLREQPSDDDAPLDVPPAPAATWWASTPNHLQLRARAESRRRTSNPEAGETVNFLLHTARNAAPLDSAVRLAMATEADANGGVSHDPLGSLGLSHDALALRQTGRGLLAAGRIEAGLKAYREAITMARNIELERAPMPSFVDDAQIHRFLLPLEETIGDLVRDLDERVTDGYASWSKAVPDDALAQLAVYRWMVKRGKPEQELAFDRLNNLPSSDDPTTEALRLASRAEAFALKDSYPSAISSYRAAIESMPDDVIKRTWLFNLGEIGRLAGDSTTMRESWDAARGPSPHDAINNRLVKAKGRAGLASRRKDSFDDSGSPVPAPFPLKLSR